MGNKLNEVWSKLPEIRQPEQNTLTNCYMAKAKETTQAVDSSALSNGNNPREKGLSHSNVSEQTQVSAANQSKTEANVNETNEK